MKPITATKPTFPPEASLWAQSHPTITIAPWNAAIKLVSPGLTATQAV